ncbi:acyl-CoA synthetase [Limnohabitans sp. 63ED37-2]|uniref:acyl-CoA synthetase n=1 Tax=Limnohabitans sp. 63ED37-2 TaxID=1678128 RepID=UPI0007062A47|nr:AMP-binding protein [Limnohabitans sp. 63ED37-2]ALK89066.1 Acetyl-coenzyme A synthetase [Limnohabitans sp. 63ED37-2]
MSVSRNQDRRDPITPDRYAAIHQGFGWKVPKRFNMAQACCGQWAAQPATARRVAIREHVAGHGLGQSWTFAQLQTAANRLSRVLQAQGVVRGDRVAIVLPQRFETAVAYMAVLQMGAVAMPLSMLFGPEALSFRINDSQARVAVCDESTVLALQQARPDCPGLQTLIGVGEAGAQADLDYAKAVASEATSFKAVSTLAEDPAVLIYTSGTTGNPKGALIPHRALIGNLTGFVCSQNWFGFDPFDASRPSKAVFWSPADWAWTGGLMDALLPSLYFGRPIVAFNGRFSPEMAFEILQTHAVTHTFLFPTALKAMMKAVPNVKARYRLKLQAMMSAGEAVGDAVFAYVQQQMGVTVNEMFGQTEINYVVGNCARLWPAKPGSMGKGYPGHQVAVIDEAGQLCPPGTPGEVAVNRLDVHGQPDPVFFLGYWNNDKATQAKYTGNWCRTGDMAVADKDGYLWYQGRTDDMFKAAGYRIGPGEIENCLVKHPAVQNAAVVPKPDADRGAVVKAYVVLSPDWLARRPTGPGQASFDDEVRRELQAHVKGLLAPYEYPKEIEFIDQLPMTTTGKVQRRVLRLQEEARATALKGPAL